MSEAAGTRPEQAHVWAELSAELDRIETAVVAGNTHLGPLGFWRVVAKVKPDRLLADRYAEQIGRIDAAAFRARVGFRLPVWAGNALLITGAGIGAAAAVLGVTAFSGTAAGWALIVAGLAWSVSLHCPAHWAVGRLVGIRFTDYFLAGSPLPYPGLKMQYTTYLRADPDSRAWMHAAGAIATKLAPFLALAFWPASDAPRWSAAALVALGLFQIATDLAFSTKTSDWMRFRRERAVARSRRSTA
jgi:hypothetical protein